MFTLVAVLAVGASSVLAIPSSPGVCQPLSSLAFAHQPAVASGLSARVVYNNLKEPRGLRFDSDGNLLVIERNIGITALTYRNDSTCVGWEKRVVLGQTDLEHGLYLGPGTQNNQFLYASSQESVFRWSYNPKTASLVGGSTTLIWNMTNIDPELPDHVTRTLLLQSPVGGVSKYLIVSRGSSGNWDGTAANPLGGPAEVRRFRLDTVPTGGKGYAWQQGEILAWGTRNSVGIAFSKDENDIWAVENGSDNIEWRGADVHQDNPAEELNKITINRPNVPISQKYYGYPSCFTVWNPAGFVNVTSPASNPKFKTGDPFAASNSPVVRDDAWCANPKNNIKPVLSMESHAAPLDIAFYDNSKCSPKDNSYGLSKKWDGDAFVSFHGSWNRDPPAGYAVVRIPWKGNGPAASSTSTTGYEALVKAANLTECPDKCIRPAGLEFDKLGRLFVSSDDTGEVFVLEKSA
ncbi:soluble quino protein glucose dehydrogenase [Ceratobasidium sp. AG-I]|nr:soluble quino protein glucose dehydrogenase [Ceratobasidium sp. AG-I]